MNTLDDVLVTLLTTLPDRSIQRIIGALETMPALRASSLCNLFSPATSSTLIQDFVDATLAEPDLTGKALAHTLRVAHKALQFQARSHGKVDLLWTGPATDSVPVRHTETALCEIINAAQKSLFIVSFVATAVPSILSALHQAAARGVQLNFLLEPSTDQGGHVYLDSLATLQHTLPRATYYRWGQHANPDSGSIHAKCAVADNTHALITSANLTNKAMDHNMELGTLFHNGPIPQQLANHLQALITEHVIMPLP